MLCMLFGIGIPFAFATATGSQSMFIVCNLHIYFYLAALFFVLKKKILKLYTETIKFRKISKHVC